MPKTGIDTKKGIHSHARRFGWETRTKLVAITRRSRGRQDSQRKNSLTGEFPKWFKPIHAALNGVAEFREDCLPFRKPFENAPFTGADWNLSNMIDVAAELNLSSRGGPPPFPRQTLLQIQE
jgi:hypothetical protein